MKDREKIQNLKVENKSLKADVTRLNKERVVLEEQLGFKEKTWRRAYGKKIKSRAKVMFWEVIFKPVLSSVLWGFTRWIEVNKSDVNEPYNCKMIHYVLVRCFPKGAIALSSMRVKWGGEILTHFLSLDYAYQQIWEKFIKDYYAIIYENKPLREIKYIDEK